MSVGVCPVTSLVLINTCVLAHTHASGLSAFVFMQRSGRQSAPNSFLPHIMTPSMHARDDSVRLQARRFVRQACVPCQRRHRQAGPAETIQAVDDVSMALAEGVVAPGVALWFGGAVHHSPAPADAPVIVASCRMHCSRRAGTELHRHVWPSKWPGSARTCRMSEAVQGAPKHHSHLCLEGHLGLG